MKNIKILIATLFYNGLLSSVVMAHPGHTDNIFLDFTHASSGLLGLVILFFIALITVIFTKK